MIYMVTCWVYLRRRSGKLLACRVDLWK